MPHYTVYNNVSPYSLVKTEAEESKKLRAFSLNHSELWYRLNICLPYWQHSLSLEVIASSKHARRKRNTLHIDVSGIAIPRHTQVHASVHILGAYENNVG
ncbi:hypothetical protein ACF0H5_021387 [Mactra antiquata]